jgi:hypothetical protein
MLGEYLAFQYPNDNVWERLRLGPLKAVGSPEGWTEQEMAMSGVFRRWADAVVQTPSELIIVEAKMRSAPGAVAQLLLYQELVDLTPELDAYRSLPQVLELVVAIDDPAVRRMAERQGIRVRVFRPDWYAAWAEALTRRAVRAPRDLTTSDAAAAGP